MEYISAIEETRIKAKINFLPNGKWVMFLTPHQTLQN